ncbi:MAG TPA: lysophospholipid acyltransferase family protein [Thiobacillus sp.]
MMASTHPLLPRTGWPRRALHRVYEYSVLWVGLVALGLSSLIWTVFALPLNLVLPKRQAVALGRGVISHAFRVYLGFLTAIRAIHFDLTELDALRAEGPMIIAPNHPCLLDALMVLSRLPGIACIMKADIVDNVFFGVGARMAGYIRNDAQLSMVKQSVAELKQGSQLLVFPEGTRTTRWPVNVCKGTTALVASRAQVPIQTVFIETDSAYLSKGWPLFRRPRFPIHYRVRLGRRFDPPGKAGTFTEDLERYFIEELCEAPRFLSPEAPQAPACEARRGGLQDDIH